MRTTTGARFLWRVLAAALGGWAFLPVDPVTVVHAGAKHAPSFAECSPAERQPWTYDALMCLRRLGLREAALPQVARLLRQLGAGAPAHPWPTLVLAHVTLDQDRRPEAVALYEAAASGFADAKDAEGEVIARQNLARQYRLRGEDAHVSTQVRLALAAAEASGVPLTIARAAAFEASEEMARGGDIGRAYRALVRADGLVTASAPVTLRRIILFNLATANLYLGHVDAALDALERHRAMRAEDGSPQDAAEVAFNLLVAHLMRDERRPRPGSHPRFVAEAEAVLTEAVAQHNSLIEAQAHQALGELLRTSDAPRAARHLRRCLAVEARLRSPGLRAECLWSLSLHESATNPRRAEAWSAQALTLLRSTHDQLSLVYAWQARLQLVWRTLPERQALAESLEALDAIERLRSAQHTPGSRAVLMDSWANAFYQVVGRLLHAAPARVDTAFEIGERLRSRVLLEYLGDAGVAAAAARSGGDAGQRLATRVARTQRQLLDDSLSAPARAALLGQLRLLELEQEELTAGRIPALSADAVPFASLAAVQRHLADGEVMLWFSTSPWTDVFGDFRGGSWVLAITRQTTTVHPIVATADLGAQVAAFTGLLRDRMAPAAAWAAPARALARTLLDAPLARLPSSATRLVVVTDGPLHGLPFEALGLAAGSALGERFEVSVVPSATVWLRARQTARRPGSRALVLADPALAARAGQEAALPALPAARREAGTIADLLALDSGDVLHGSSASERRLKQASLAPFSVVHLAAHARADATAPERSAVFLAPGDDEEDGWLQPREIAALDLSGRVVVLSACESGAGVTLSGEGPLSLARAFFAGGASSVVATRWPLRDDDAARLMRHFYRALAEGETVSGALRDARHAARAEGLPASVWAGVASLGDGLGRPIAARARGSRPWPWTLGVAVAALGAVATAASRRRRLAA